MNPTDEQIRELLRRAQTIAVVGLSDNPERPSHGVGRYLLDAGYTVLPVNPNIEVILGLKAYPRLEDAGDRVDIVDVFRRSEHLPEIAESAAAIGAGVLWGQLGVVNNAAAEHAEAAGLTVVMDRCIAIEHRRLVAPGVGEREADA